MCYDYPTRENLEFLNSMGLTYPEMCTFFQTKETAETIKYHFRKLNIKHKSKSDLIDDYLEINPMASSKEVAKKFGVSSRLVNIVKQKKPKMTRAVFKWNKENVEFCIAGHSNYANKGYDIVCASISSMAFYVINTIQLLEMNIKSTIKNGFIHVVCPITIDSVYVMLESLQEHLKELSRQYPENVRIYVKRSDN